MHQFLTKFTWLWAFQYTLKAHRKLTIIVSCISLCIASLPALNVLAIKYVSESFNAQQSLLLPLVFLVVNFAVTMIVSQALDYYKELLSDQVFIQVNNDFEQQIIRFPAAQYADSKHLDLLRNTRTAVEKKSVFNSFSSCLQLIAGCFTVASLLLALGHIDFQAALVAIFAPVPIIVNYFLRFRINDKYWDVISRSLRRADYYNEQLIYQRPALELATLGGTQLIARKSREHVIQGTQKHLTKELKFAILELIAGILTTALFGICVYLLVHNLQLTAIIAAIAGLTSYLQSLKNIGRYVNTLNNSLVPNRNLQKFLAFEPQAQTFTPLVMGDSLNFTGVSVRYGDKVAVDNVEITLNKDGFTALVGLNGCGKTSLLKAMMGTQLDSQGELHTESHQLPLNQLQGSLDYATVQQEFGRYEIVLRDFLSLGMTRTVSEEEYWRALDQVGLQDFVQNLPLQLDTMLGEQWEKGINLSGGQWQRLALARVFLKRTPVLFLDEPTSAIDAQIEETIFENLTQLSHQSLILLTTHRASTLKNARWIYVMREGKIVEQGTFSQLNQQGTYFHELFAAQLIA